MDDLERARVHLLRAQIAFARRRGSDAPRLLLSAARELEAVDPLLARATYLEALARRGSLAGWLVARACGGERGGAAGPPAATAAAPLDLLLEGLAIRFTEGTRRSSASSSRR